jgi:hypothetical protein
MVLAGTTRSAASDLSVLTVDIIGKSFHKGTLRETGPSGTAYCRIYSVNGCRAPGGQRGGMCLQAP